MPSSPRSCRVSLLNIFQSKSLYLRSCPCLPSSPAQTPAVILNCVPRCSRGDGMVPWIPSALGHPTQQVWGARSLNSGQEMRICTSLLSNVGFSVGSRESEGPFLGILTSHLGSEDSSISASPSPPPGTQELWMELEDFRQPHLCSPQVLPPPSGGRPSPAGAGQVLRGQGR